MTTRGYEATSIGDLATELGISKAAIAYYFRTKEAFLDELIAPFLDQLEEAVLAAPTARDALASYLEVVIDHHDIAIWLDTDPAVLNHPVHRAHLDTVNNRLLRIITSGSRRRADRLRALATLGGIWRPARESSPDELRQHFDEIVDAALASY
jgi:AcrR family transcriptional regulator